MASAELLKELGGALASGGIKVVDLSGRLGPDTPILQLPPDFAKNTPKVEIHKISEYDSDGPFFAWNWLVLGEHSGTHFDAPHHWITGKDFADGYTDTLDLQRIVAPVNVIDCSKQAAEDPDFLLTADGVKEWEAEHGEIGAGEKAVQVSGQIDRLVVTPSEVFLVDYKTNRPPPDRVLDVPDQYVRQLAVYRALLGEIYPEHEIRCALLWTWTPELMVIPREMIDHAIVQLSAEVEQPAKG